MRQVLEFNIVLLLQIIMFLSYVAATEKHYRDLTTDLTDHTMVTDNGVFPFVAAILLKSMYLSAGALINEFWVLTAADSLFLIRESTRIIRVRLGSVNNKKGGHLYPVKSIQIHPGFDDNSPQFDIALVLLPRRVKFTEYVNPIKLQPFPRQIVATHFIVNAWPPHIIPSALYPNHTESIDMIKRRRILTVSHLHPSTRDNCSKELQYWNLSATGTIMCLDPAIGTDPCLRDVGAPVVLNGVLWGIMSSWKPDDCDVDPGPIFVTLVSAKNVSTWINAAIEGNRWNFTAKANRLHDYDEYDYSDVEK